jgi:subtilisin family serine protease
MKSIQRQTLFLCSALLALFFVVGAGRAFAAASDAQFFITPNDQLYAEQWYLEKIKAPQAWAMNHDSSNVVVAVIDTGVDIDHPDLINNIWINEKEIPVNGIDDDRNGYIDDINGWDFVNNAFDPNPKFQNGFTDIGLHHGTIVSGIIAAEGNNAFGITGVAWNAQIMALKVLNDRGEGTTEDVIRAIDYATNNGADIINLSFVGPDYSSSLAEAIERAFDAGVLVVAAAGNEDANGLSHDLSVTPAYPICNDNGRDTIIGVGGTDPLDQKAEFSNFGSNCIDIVAPATSFVGLVVYDPRRVYGGKVYNLYAQGYWSGTSMSAPLVSGALALLKGVNPKLTRQQLTQTIFETAANIDALNPDFKGDLGAGRLDVAAAVQKVYDDLHVYQGFVIAAPQSNASTTVNVYTEIPAKFKAYGEEFQGGAAIATGDVNGDGQDEIITGAGQGGGPHVRIFNEQGTLLGQFFAFDSKRRNGVNVAAGDINGDGISEIIAAENKGGLPYVRVFNLAGNKLAEFVAYPMNFRGGVNVSAGDVNGDGKDEIITGAGFGGGPQVRIFDASGTVRGQFFAYGENFRGGVNVAAGDANQDGIEEIITGAGPGGGPHVRVFDERGSLFAGFFSYTESMHGGVNVAVLKLKVQ